MTAKGTLALALFVAAAPACIPGGFSGCGEMRETQGYYKGEGGPPVYPDPTPVLPDCSGADADPPAELPSNVFVGTWNPVPSLPSCCPLRVAADAAASIPALQWATCAGPAMCEKAVVDWTTRGHRIGFNGIEPVRLVNGTPMMTYQRYYATEGQGQERYYAFIEVVLPVNGSPLFALGRSYKVQDGGDNYPCAPAIGLSNAGLGHIFTYPGAEASTLGWSGWEAPGAIETKHVTLEQLGLRNGVGGIQNVSRGSSNLFLRLESPRTVRVFGIDSGVIHYPPTPLVAEDPREVADGALVLDTTISFSIRLLRPDGGHEELVVPTAPHAVTSMALDRSNADAIVWVESEPGLDYTSSVIWTAPYANSPSVLARRKVARLRDSTASRGARMVANAGVVLNLSGVTTALLTRLSDGAGWTIHAESGTEFHQPVWVDDDHVWLTTGAARSDTSGLARFPRAFLGPPTVSRGF
jgi:hypothetical protein